jgi:hypothetical protein
MTNEAKSNRRQIFYSVRITLAAVFVRRRFRLDRDVSSLSAVFRLARLTDPSFLDDELATSETLKPPFSHRCPCASPQILAGLFAIAMATFTSPDATTVSRFIPTDEHF